MRRIALILPLLVCHWGYGQDKKISYKLIKTITGKLSPKSINNNGKNLFFAQNMMYNHTVAVYDSSFNLVSTIKDNVTPSQYGFKDIAGSLNGSPVEGAATKDGKYLWVSNYFMSGQGYTNPGCDTCYGKGYDKSFVYKINTTTCKIESIVEVGSVPKYLAITPDQQKLIVSNWSSGDVSIVDLKTEKEIKRISVGPAPRGIACDTASTYAYVAVMGCSKICKINLGTYQSETFVSGIRNPRHLCIDDNYLYASLNGEGSVCRINLVSAKLEKLAVGLAPRSMVISVAKKKLFVDCYEDSKVAVINLSTFKLDTEIKTYKYPIGICLNNRADQVWVSCYTGFIQVFSETTRTIADNAIASVKKKTDSGKVTIVKVNKPPIQVSVKTIVTASEKPKPVNDGNKQYIVLGSFLIKENALNLKDKLSRKGLAVELINTNKGYTYCACKAKDDKEETEKLISQLEALTGIKGWVYEI